MHQRGPQRQRGSGLVWIAGNTIIWALWPWIAGLAGLVVWVVYDQFLSQWMHLRVLRILFGETNRLLIAMLLMALGFGGILAAFQRALLSRRLRIVLPMWVPATVTGVLLNATIPLMGAAWSQDLLVLRALGLLSMLPLGIAQWLVLRRRVRGALWWVAASAFALVIPSLLMPTHGGSPLLVRTGIGYALTGLAYAAATLVALRLMSQPTDVPGEEAR